MATTIQGTFTLRQCLELTKQSKEYRSRFEYKKRDRIKVIKIKKIQYFDRDRIGAPSVLYEIITQSTPQYKPYIGKDKRGRLRKSQRSIKHDYDCILQVDKLSIDTVHWRGRVGFLRKIKPAPQIQVATIHKATRAKWVKLSTKQGKTLKEQKEWLNKKINAHKKKARYLSDGDYQAQKMGINLDFIYRAMFAWKKHGHLYQKGGYIESRPSKLNPQNIPFLPKHMILLVEELLKQGILKQG